jgi:cobalt-precorrin 5A hydrolase/precorrin-3B C17-methyltransferase
LPYEHHHGDLVATVRRRWADVDGFVLFCATGLAVRAIAPLLADKAADPAVVCVDEAGRHAIALVGGHRAGANRLAARVAGLLDAEAVLTTATDAAGVPSLDQLPGFTTSGDVAAATRAALDGDPPPVIDELGWPVPLRSGTGPGHIVVTDRAVDPAPGQVVLCPPSLVVGVGASSGAPAGAAADLLAAALDAAGLAVHAVALVATIDRRAADPVVTALGHPVRAFPPEVLATVAVPNPSAVVSAEVGTASVAEAAALLAAGPGAELVVPKAKGATATVAVARRRRPEGMVQVVGLGPGDPGLRTPRAEASIRHADVVIGYSLYVEQCQDLLSAHQEVVRSPIGAEVDRCAEALRRAAAGQRVALVCSGDPGVFAMATLVVELGPRHGDPPVEVVPGVTASLAASAVLGAPLGHDHALISLSDLLTPWEVIERRVEAAAVADLAVAFYNPRSQRRTHQLARARDLLLAHRPATTPVGIVTNATRPGQRVERTTLGRLDPARVDMSSVVIVGSSTTTTSAGGERLFTPRGYQP